MSVRWPRLIKLPYSVLKYSVLVHRMTILHIDLHYALSFISCANVVEWIILLHFSRVCTRLPKLRHSSYSSWVFSPSLLHKMLCCSTYWKPVMRLQGGLLIIRSLYHVLLFYLSSYFTCITCFSFTCIRAFLVYLLLVTPTFRKPALNTYITTKPATNTAINQYSLTTW